MSTTPPERPEDPFGRGEESGDAQDAFGAREGGVTSGDPLGGSSGNLGDTYGTQQPPAQPQQSYAPPTQQGYAPAPAGGGQTPGDATASLVLGIVGLLFCVFAAIPAIILGNRAKKQIDANPGAFGGRGLAQAGVILGWVAAGLWGLFLMLVILGAAL